MITFGTAQLTQLPARLRCVGAHSLEAFDKKSPMHQAWVRAPPSPFASPIVRLKLAASLLSTLLQALLTNVAILSKTNARSAFLTALPRIVLT